MIENKGCATEDKEWGGWAYCKPETLDPPQKCECMEKWKEDSTSVGALRPFVNALPARDATACTAGHRHPAHRALRRANTGACAMHARARRRPCRHLPDALARQQPPC